MYNHTFREFLFFVDGVFVFNEIYIIAKEKKLFLLFVILYHCIFKLRNEAKLKKTI